MYYDENSTLSISEELLRYISEEEILNYIEQFVYNIDLEDLMPYHIKEDINIIIRLERNEVSIINRYSKGYISLYLGILKSLKSIADHNNFEHEKEMEQEEYQEYLKLKEKYEK